MSNPAGLTVSRRNLPPCHPRLMLAGMTGQRPDHLSSQFNVFYYVIPVEAGIHFLVCSVERGCRWACSETLYMLGNSLRNLGRNGFHIIYDKEVYIWERP